MAILITSDGEGFPNVALEAALCGRAVISRKNNALSQYNRAQGIIHAETVKDFVKIISETVVEEFVNIGLNGYEYFRNNFSTEIIINKIMKHF